MHLNDVVTDTIALTAHSVRRHGARLLTELAADLPHTWGDRVQLQQVLVNLVVNGAEAMSTVENRRRDLVIRTRADGAHVVVDVVDSGPGIPEDRHRTIFKAFQSSKPGGMGMGLSISRTIVQTHDGTLTVTPNEAHGVTFHVSLPSHRTASTGSMLPEEESA